MTDINPTPSWVAVRQLEIGEFALGGANGNMNEQAKALAARSEFLKQRAAYQYNTLVEANADIANIAVNQNVNVVDSGLHYKATSGATSLTKSQYDPIEFTKQKLGTRLTTAASLNALDYGAYFISSSDLLTIISDGSYIDLGYPTEITALGGAKINVVKSGATFNYQTLELTRQGLSFYRQGTGVADTFYEWVSDVSAAIAEANKNPKFNPYQRSIGVITDITTSDSTKTSIFQYSEGIFNIPRTTVLRYADRPEDTSILLEVINVETSAGNYTKFTAVTTTNNTYVSYRNNSGISTPWDVLSTSGLIDSKITAYNTSLKAENPILNSLVRRLATITVVPNSGGNTAIIQYGEGYFNIQRTKVLTFADRPEDSTLMLEVSLLNTANGGYYFFKAESSTGSTYTRHSIGGLWQGDWKKIASTKDIADAIATIPNNAVKSDPDNCVIGLGSSSIAYMETKLRELVRSKGREYIGGGFAATHAQTLAMFCGYGTYYMNFATDTVLQNDIEYDITWTNAGDFGTNDLNPVGSLTKWWVVLDNGVRGQVVLQTGKFTPKNLSENLTVSGAIKVLPHLAQYKRSIAVIQTGKNNISTGTIAQISNAKNSYDEIIRQINLSQQDSRYIVLGHHVNYGVTEAVKNGVLEVNTYLKNKYKNRYLDIQNWLMSSQVWTDLGIAPTSADTAAQSNGWIPPSISSDGVHLDTAYSDYYAQNFIIPKLESMGFL